MVRSRKPELTAPANNFKPNISSRPFAADDAGESDFDFFRARPNARTRNRLPYANEFAPELLDQGGLDCFVHVIVERDAAGQPTRRARGLLFCDGGNA